MYLQVQVQFNQGLVKTFLAPHDILMSDFINVVRRFGKFRSVRFYPDVDEQAARFLASTGNAVMVEVKHGQA